MLTARVGAQPSVELPPPPVPPAESEIPPTAGDDVLERKQIQFQTLQSQLQELSELWEEIRPQERPATAPNTPSTIVGPPQSTTSSAGESAGPLEGPPDVLRNDSFGEPKTESESRPAEPDGPQAKYSEPVDGPIDRFALTSSLFATGSYRECLSVLDAIEFSKLRPYEKSWATYLQACCYRKLGQEQSAQQLYRSLVADPESGWVGEVSRWWLDHLQQKATLQKEYETLVTTVLQWEKQTNELSRIKQ